MEYKKGIRSEMIIDKALEIIRNSPSNCFTNGFVVRDVVSVIRFQTDSKLIPHSSTIRHYLMLKRKRGEVDIIVKRVGYPCTWGFVDNGGNDGTRPKEDRA